MIMSDAPLVERALAPFKRFAEMEAAGGIVLLACTAVALVWANSPWADAYQHLWELELALVAGPLEIRSTLHHLINDGLMAVFFFLVGLEIKREVLVGELASLRRAALPIAGAVGGIVVPAALYALLNAGGPGIRGWAVPMATDIAFALGVLALLGDRVPLGLKVFLAALAIVDDIAAVLVIAAFYSEGISWNHLMAAGGLLLLALSANAAGVRRPAAYAVIGVVLWAAIVGSGIHATVAGVLLALTIPVKTRIDGSEFLGRANLSLSEFAAREEPASPILAHPAQQSALFELEQLTERAQSPLARLEHALHGVVAFGIMPLFALANAGVRLDGGELGAMLANPVTAGVILGLLAGKPLGITLASWLSVRTGLSVLPGEVTWRALHGVGWLGGIGFTMALFIAGLAFPGRPELLASAKIGILTASLLAGVGGWLLLRLWGGVRSTASQSSAAPRPAAGAAATPRHRAPRPRSPG
jgi:Na+:H+ antiporter, NhaA family